jgi:hypothetical protein
MPIGEHLALDEAAIQKLDADQKKFEEMLHKNVTTN